jgi:hypothetical protein
VLNPLLFDYFLIIFSLSFLLYHKRKKKARKCAKFYTFAKTNGTIAIRRKTKRKTRKSFFVKFHLSVKNAKSPSQASTVKKGISNPATKTFAPPPGFEPNSNDLSQPAIWNNSNFGRTINLFDD